MWNPNARWLRNLTIIIVNILQTSEPLIVLIEVLSFSLFGQFDLLRLHTPVIKHRQKLLTIERNQSRPHTVRLPHSDLISPGLPAIPTRNQLRRRPQRIVGRRSSKRIILIRNKTHHKRARHIQHLRRASTSIRTRRSVDDPSIAPSLAIIRRGDGTDIERANNRGLKDGDQSTSANGGDAGHTITRRETCARDGLSRRPRCTAVGRKVLERVLVVEGVLTRIVQLQRAVERVAQEWLPEAVDGAGFRGGLTEEQPTLAQVVGVADGDAEVGVAAITRVFRVIAECDDEAA